MKMKDTKLEICQYVGKKSFNLNTGKSRHAKCMKIPFKVTYFSAERPTKLQ